MAGQVIKKGENNWLIRIFLGRDANGKRKYFSKAIHGPKKDATKFLTAKLREKDQGVFIEPASMSLNEFLDRWLEEIAKQKLRERTFDNYESLLRCHVRYKIGANRLCDIQAIEIQKLYNEMKKVKFSPKTIRHVHNVLSSALKQAVRWKMLVQNPCDLCELPRQEKSEMMYFTPQETIKFLEVAKDDKLFLVFFVALETGMRPEEYLALQWRDVDFENKTVVVRRALVARKGGGFIFTEPKTARSRRTIPLSNSVISALKFHRRTQLEGRLKHGSEYQNYDLIFASERGTPIMHRNLLRRHFKPILEKAKLPDIRLYDLRHTTATLLLSTGENPKVVSERLGHASIVLTLDTYSHVLPNMQKEATGKLERMLYG